MGYAWVTAGYTLKHFKSFSIYVGGLLREQFISALVIDLDTGCYTINGCEHLSQLNINPLILNKWKKQLLL